MFNVIDRNPGFKIFQVINIFRNKFHPVDDENLLFFGYARGALFAILKSLGLKKGDGVLVPSYICDVVIHQIEALDLDPIYYRVDKNLKIDFNSLGEHVVTRSKVFISINYFGFSQEFLGIGKLTNEKNLVWINDNAHGFSSHLFEKSLDAYGDVSITSFRKSIPSINGAYLKINNSKKIDRQALKKILELYTVECISFKLLIAKVFGVFKIRLKKYPDFSNFSLFKDTRNMQYKVNESSRILMNKPDVFEMQKRRIKIYLGIKYFIEQNYSSIKVPDLYEDGNVPLNFPIIVENKNLWLEILRISRKEGVDIHTWPSLPSEVLGNNIYGAYDLWQKWLFLPLHQNLELATYLERLSMVLSQIGQYEQIHKV